jgi:hypothetical protein
MPYKETIMDSIKPRSPDWNCPMCFEHMNGEINGDVVISTRCFHSFHKECLDQWMNVDQFKRCPTCRMDHESIEQIVPNPEFSEYCKKALADPENYKYEDAYRAESLRPESLRGQVQGIRKKHWRDLSREMHEQALRDHPPRCPYHIQRLINYGGVVFFLLTLYIQYKILTILKSKPLPLNTRTISVLKR